MLCDAGLRAPVSPDGTGEIVNGVPRVVVLPAALESMIVGV